VVINPAQLLVLVALDGLDVAIVVGIDGAGLDR
jgi:hypothetical protein